MVWLMPWGAGKGYSEAHLWIAYLILGIPI